MSINAGRLPREFERADETPGITFEKIDNISCYRRQV